MWDRFVVPMHSLSQRRTGTNIPPAPLSQFFIFETTKIVGAGHNLGHDSVVTKSMGPHNLRWGNFLLTLLVMLAVLLAFSVVAPKPPIPVSYGALAD